MPKNSTRQPPQSPRSSTNSNAGDGRGNRKDLRVSPISKRIIEEFSVERRNVMRELANR